MPRHPPRPDGFPAGLWWSRLTQVREAGRAGTAPDDEGDEMSTTMTVDYDCCGTRYEQRLVLRDDQTLLHNATLGDQMIAMLDAQHDAEHPECSEASR